MPDHSAMESELLVPNANKIDGPRLNMVCNHLNQALVLDDPEPPLVFTNFENQVGEVSSSILRYDNAQKLLRKIKKNESTYAVIFEDEVTGKIDFKEITSSKRLTEHYGYMNRVPDFDSLEEGMVIRENEVICAASSYDDELNLGFGKNLKTIFYNHQDGTIEDAIVISESAAEKMKFTEITEYGVLINSNDVLLNLYGDTNDYRCLPNVYQETVNGIICARRRYEKRSSFARFTDATARKIIASDAVFSGNGYVEDITVYSNVPSDSLNEPWCAQIKEILDNQERYWLEIIEALWPYKDTGKLTPDASYAIARYSESVQGPHSEKRPWIAKNEFDFLYLVIKVCHQRPLEVGCKITNRYGSKGVISKILPDAEMPETEDGDHAEVCMSPLGIIGRLNPGALFELAINEIADNFKKRGEGKSFEERLDTMYECYKSLNYDQYFSLKDYVESLEPEEQEVFVDEMYAKGFPIHMPPFFGNISFEEYAEIIESYDIKQTKFKGIDRPLTFAKAYFMRLKQEPSGKQSARCVGLLSSKGVPNKSKSAKSTDILSKTPIRLGEQETSNLMFSGNISDIFDLLSFNSQSAEDRLALATALINKKEGEEIKLTRKGNNVPKSMLSGYLSGLGLKIEK